ncbi:MAG TPA: hypothetical protein VIM11_07870 [Tepidisphaeraceae bacterium]|jgi:hypothetical protein
MPIQIQHRVSICGLFALVAFFAKPALAAPTAPDYHFDGPIPRQVLENYLDRSITMEGMLHGRSDIDDDIRMLKSMGAKFIGRGICFWSGEGSFLKRMEMVRTNMPKVHAADPDMIVQACIFEIVGQQVEQIPVPEWAFTALGMPVEKRNFRYADMIYQNGASTRQWGRNSSVPDVSRPETQLWFYFQAVSYIDAGAEAIHFGQVELMNRNDKDLTHYASVFDLVRNYASKHARRHWVICDAHVPHGGLVKDGKLLLDVHAFPLRIKEVPDKPQEAILDVGFSDGIYHRSKGGIAPSGYTCEHLPFLVEFDNFGVSRTPGKAGAGTIWVWGYDEITWFAVQPRAYRAKWLEYAWKWLRETDPDGHLEMPGSRTMRSPVDGRRWYYANNKSAIMPEGNGDEDAIRAVWEANRMR